MRSTLALYFSFTRPGALRLISQSFNAYLIFGPSLELL